MTSPRLSVSAFMIAFCSLAVQLPASAKECDAWPCFNDTQKPDADAQWQKKHSTTLDSYAKNLRILNRARVIRVSAEQVISSDLRSLIGQYAVVEDEDGVETLRPIGSTYRPELREVKIKDESIFKGIVSRSFNAGATLPVLQVDLGAKDVAELAVDTISAAFVDTDANRVSCNFPLAYRKQAESGEMRVVFISGANVTRVRKQFFQEGSAGASGAFAIVSLNGTTYISDKTILTDYIVLPYFVEARPVDASLCPVRRRPAPRGAQIADRHNAKPTGVVVAHDISHRVMRTSELERLVMEQRKVFKSEMGSELKVKPTTK